MIVKRSLDEVRCGVYNIEPRIVQILWSGH